MATAILELRATDGWNATVPYTQTPAPGVWRPTLPANAPNRDGYSNGRARYSIPLIKMSDSERDMQVLLSKQCGVLFSPQISKMKLIYGT